MKYIDQHMHTIFSPDAYPNATMENYILEAKNVKQEGLMFTDHVDIDSPVPMFFQSPNYDQYFNTVQALQETTSLPLYTGVEVGYQPSIISKLDDFVNKYPFDLVICSIHVADGLDFHYGDFFTGKTIDQSIKRYFEVVLDAVTNYDNYDVFGHIDYITRYIKEITHYDFEEYKGIITKILQTIIAKNKGIELNASKGRGEVFPSLEVLALYKKLGGKYITIGSDAHTPSKLQQHFEDAIMIAKKAGFTTIYQYVKRKPVPILIEDL